MKVEIDFEEIAKKLEAQEPYYDPGSDMKKKSLYIGSCISIMPSGKDFTSGACSYVKEEEIKKDGEYMEALEREASKYDLTIESGEDPCDLYVSRYFEEED